MSVMPRSRRTPFFLSLVSIALVLFFLGFFAVLVLIGKSAVDRFRAERPLRLMMAEGTTEAQARKLMQQLQNQPYVRSVAYQSRQDALTEMRDLGEDFLQAMDNFNPLPASIQIQLQPDYISSDQVLRISKEVLQYPEVFEVVYPIQLIEQVNRNVRLAAQIAVPLGIVFLGVTYLLVFNTIRLAIFGRRLVIRSMQLVGATNAFVRRPFVQMGILQGFLGGLLASGLLLLLLVLLTLQMRDAFEIDLQPLAAGTEIIILYLALVVTGTLLGWLASRLAVSRYLNRTLDEIA